MPLPDATLNYARAFARGWFDSRLGVYRTSYYTTDRLQRVVPGCALTDQDAKPYRDGWLDAQRVP